MIWLIGHKNKPTDWCFFVTFRRKFAILFHFLCFYGEDRQIGCSYTESITAG